MTGSPVVRGRATNGQQVALTGGGDGDYRFGSRSLIQPVRTRSCLKQSARQRGAALIDAAAREQQLAALERVLTVFIHPNNGIGLTEA
jgi:hypothetical protein